MEVCESESADTRVLLVLPHSCVSTRHSRSNLSRIDGESIVEEWIERLIEELADEWSILRHSFDQAVYESRAQIVVVQVCNHERQDD